MTIVAHPRVSPNTPPGRAPARPDPWALAPFNRGRLDARDGSSAKGPSRMAAVLASREVLLVLVVSAVWYLLGVGYLLVYLRWYDPDTLSRLANAFYVLHSREPHLAAIGFVWPPLLGVTMLPALLLTPWWPWMASYGLAAGLLSAAAGTLFATFTFAILRVAGVPRWGCWAFIGALWVNPMFWYASANGLSEMPFLLLLLLSSWLLWHWLAGPSDDYLAILANGTICAAALMIRYEMLAWAGAVSAVTLGASFLARSACPSLGRRERMQRAQAFTLAFALPWGFVFLVWIFFNWQIVGNPLYFLVSAYSNVAQTGVDFASVENPILAPAVGSVGGAVWFVTVRVAFLNPALFACFPLVAIVALRQRSWHGLALIAPALAVLALDTALLYRATLNSLLRYHLFSVPATLVPMAWLYRTWANRPGACARRQIATGVLVATGWSMVATSAWAMADPVLGHGTRDAFVDFTTATPANAFNADRDLASYLDGLELSDGSVLIDSANGYGVIVSSRRPRQFVINSDSDFLTTLVHPQDRVAYIAVGATDNFDIISRTYPHLFETGEPFGSLEREFGGTPRMGALTPTVWRLYRVETSNVGPSPAPIAEQPVEPGLTTVSPEKPVARETPMATETPVALVQPAATPTDAPLTDLRLPEPALPMPRLLLDENFVERGASPGWPHTPGTALPSTTGYWLQAGRSNRFVAIAAPLGALSYNDVVVTGRFRKAGGPPGGGYGLIVSDRGPGPRDGLNQGGNYWVLESSDLGDIGIWRRERQRWIDVVPWRPDPAVRLGDATNELEAQVSAGVLTFSINGKLVERWTGTIAPQGAVGVFLGGDANEAVVERFTVSALE